MVSTGTMAALDRASLLCDQRGTPVQLRGMSSHDLKQFPFATNTVSNLAVNLAVQVVAIIAMRSIGLFYRHYACYFSKSW